MRVKYVKNVIIKVISSVISKCKKNTVFVFECELIHTRS